ncbi:hypothetical protein ABK040_000685 [Willaertia magna]
MNSSFETFNAHCHIEKEELISPALNKNKVFTYIDKEELLDVYNQDRTINLTVKPKSRYAFWNANEYKYCTHSILYDKYGNLLMHQRSKYISFPLMWDAGACGYIKTKESSKECALREIQEELGINNFTINDLNHLIKLTIDNIHIDVYLIRFDGIEEYVKKNTFNNNNDSSGKESNNNVNKQQQFSKYEVNQVCMMHWKEYFNKLLNKTELYYYGKDIYTSGYINMEKQNQKNIRYDNPNIRGGNLTSGIPPEYTDMGNKFEGQSNTTSVPGIPYSFKGVKDDKNKEEQK